MKTFAFCYHNNFQCSTKSIQCWSPLLARYVCIVRIIWPMLYNTSTPLMTTVATTTTWQSDGKKSDSLISIIGVVYEFNQSIHIHKQTIRSVLLENIYNQHVWHMRVCSNGVDEYIEYLWRILFSRVTRECYLKKNTLHHRFYTHSVHWWITYTALYTHVFNAQNWIF